MSGKLGTDSRGNFKKFIAGQTFYLGRDEDEALVRAARLKQLWAAVKDSGGWTEEAKGIGLAIARGAQEIPVPLSGLGTFSTMERIAKLQAAYPFVRFVAEAGPSAEVVREEQQTEAARLRQEANVIEHGQAGGIGFHAALDAFVSRSVLLNKEPGTGQPTENALRVARNVKILQEHHEDFPMSAMTLGMVDGIISHWANRPVVKRSGKPAAKDTCREQIKVFRRFLGWAGDNELWQQPKGYRVKPVRIRMLEDEFAAKATAEQVRRFKVAELRILWQYARPLERLFMVLALNCGFGQREVITLRLSEIGPDKIKRLRRKTVVYGEWKLWPETLAALEWYRGQRPQSEAPQLMLTKNGVPYAKPSDKGNSIRAIANAWYRLLDRVEKDHKGFPRLSFNKLRKTAGDFVRRAADGETMAVFHSRGNPVKEDPFSEVYSNRPFRRVFKALRRIHKLLTKKVFATVEDPFPAKPIQTVLSLGTIARIKTMKAQGFKNGKIAEELGVSKKTVWRYARKK